MKKNKNKERWHGLLNGFLLVDVIKMRYKEKNGDSHISPTAEKNFIKDNRKKVTDYFKALGLEEYLDDFKRSSCSGASYYFFEEERDFICAILNLSKDEQFLLVRENRFKDMSDDTAIVLFDFLYEMFKRRGFTGDELNCRIEKPYNLLDYPVRRINRGIDRMKKDLEGIQTFVLKPQNRIVTSPNDNYEWLKYVEADLKKTIDGYYDLFSRMSTNRKDEIFHLPFLKLLSMTFEDQEKFRRQEELRIRIIKTFLSYEEMQPLLEEENTIMGIPDPASKEALSLVPRTDYTKEDEKRLKEILEQKRLYYEKATKQAVTEIAEERGESEYEVTKYVVGEWDGLISSKELLEEALEELK